jgi:hypothetical protein
MDKLTITQQEKLPCEIPQDIIDACKEIWDKAYKVADSTQISHLQIPKDTTVYKRIHSPNPQSNQTSLKDEVFVSYLCRWTLNMCELIEKDWDFYSLPMYPKNINRRMNFIELVWELALFSILFEGTSPDRCIIPRDDRRSNTNEHITGGNCRIFQEGSYSIFDVLFKDVWTISKEGVPLLFLEVFSALYEVENVETFTSIESFMESGLLDQDFWNHIIQKCSEFLEKYEWEDWKNFFFSQMKKSMWMNAFSQQKCDSYYQKFMANLKNIQSVFLDDNCCISSYISSEGFRDFCIRNLQSKLTMLQDTK